MIGTAVDELSASVVEEVESFLFSAALTLTCRRFDGVLMALLDFARVDCSSDVPVKEIHTITTTLH